MRRDLYPTLLRKSDRGKFHNIGNVPIAYGKEQVADGVSGIELLEAYERGEIAIEDGKILLNFILLRKVYIF